MYNIYAVHTHTYTWTPGDEHTSRVPIKWRQLEYNWLKFKTNYIYLIQWNAWKQMYFWNQSVPINALPYFKPPKICNIAGNQKLHPTSDIPHDPTVSEPYQATRWRHQMERHQIITRCHIWSVTRAHLPLTRMNNYCDANSRSFLLIPNEAFNKMFHIYVLGLKTLQV